MINDKLNDKDLEKVNGGYGFAQLASMSIKSSELSNYIWRELYFVAMPWFLGKTYYVGWVLLVGVDSNYAYVIPSGKDKETVYNNLINAQNKDCSVEKSDFNSYTNSFRIKNNSSTCTYFFEHEI